MLDPRNETGWEGLFEVFQPPEGYRLAAAFGTTFGLSLDALVAALLAMGECDPDTMAGDAVAQVGRSCSGRDEKPAATGPGANRVAQALAGTGAAYPSRR